MSGAGAAAGLFAVLHGAGNGILTIARGTLPLALYGPKDYGYRLGLLGAPARMAQAAAPLLFDVLIEWMGARVLWVTSGLCLAALVALLLVRQSRHSRPLTSDCGHAASCTPTAPWPGISGLTACGAPEKWPECRQEFRT